MSHTPLIPAKAGIQKATRDTETLHTLPMSFFVYILASRRNGTLYIGMTDDLTRRYFEHKIESRPGFTKRHGVKSWFGTKNMGRAKRRSSVSGS